MTYPEGRAELLKLAAQVNAVLNQFPREQRHLLHGVFVDDVFDLGNTADPELLREAFIEVNREFWRRENPPPNQLRLVEGEKK